MKTTNAPVLVTLALGQALVSCQEILFEQTLENGEFHGVYEMGGHVYASSVEGSDNNEGFLSKFSLNGDLESKVSVGVNNNLAQIAPLGDSAIVLNPGQRGALDGVQAFSTSTLVGLWSNNIVTEAATTCAPIVVQKDSNNNNSSSGEYTVISGFREQISPGQIAAIFSNNAATQWSGPQGKPCGVLSKDQQVLYVSSVPLTPQSRVVAYNSTTGEELDASEVTDPLILGSGVALSDDETSLFVSFSSHVQRFDANNLKSTTVFTTDFPMASSGQSPILSKDGTRLYVSNGSTVLRAYEIDNAQSTATRLWQVSGLHQAYAAVSLFDNETAVLVPISNGVAAYATEDGTLLWQKNLGSNFGVPQAITVNDVENRAYVAGGKLVSIEIGDGTTSPAPTDEPSASPSYSPTLSMSPSASPSLRPSAAPSVSMRPSQSPTLSQQPSASPSQMPSQDLSSAANRRVVLFGTSLFTVLSSVMIMF